jgi:hypothetical protein
MIPGFVDYYFEAVAEPWGPYGGTLEHRPPYRVRINENDSKPVISLASPQTREGANYVSAEVHVEAKAKIAFVRAHYKPMPATYEWSTIEMRPTSDTNYAAALPLHFGRNSLLF